MSNSRDRRIARLERKRGPKEKIIYVWRDAPRQSVSEAIAQRCPDGVPAGAQLVICSWQSESNPPSPARR